MENKYLEKIASWQEPPNKYLEKIAGFFSTVGGWMGKMKTIPRGGGTAGSTFNALDQMVGGGIRTIQKATKTKAPLTRGFKDSISTQLNRPKIAPGIDKAKLMGDRKDFFKNLREQKGMVKDPSKVSFSTSPSKGIKNRQQGYEPIDPAKAKNNPFLDKIVNRNQLDNNRIGTARAKIAIGATGLAGTAALGYHMANKNNSQPQYQDYGAMPY